MLHTALGNRGSSANCAHDSAHTCWTFISFLCGARIIVCALILSLNVLCMKFASSWQPMGFIRAQSNPDVLNSKGVRKLLDTSDWRCDAHCTTKIFKMFRLSGMSSNCGRLGLIYLDSTAALVRVEKFMGLVWCSFLHVHVSSYVNCTITKMLFWCRTASSAPCMFLRHFLGKSAWNNSGSTLLWKHW